MTAPNLECRGALFFARKENVMTDKELETLRRLQAKQKKEKRTEQIHYQWADKHKDDLLRRWGLDLKGVQGNTCPSETPEGSDSDRGLIEDKSEGRYSDLKI